MGKIINGLGALVILALSVAGVPWLLITMAGNPLPTQWDPHSFVRSLTRPDDGTILIHLVAVIAWIAWLVFTVSVVVEWIAALSRQRIRIRLPGLAGPQQLAGGLVLLVMAMFMAPQQFAAADPIRADHHRAHPPTTSVSTPRYGKDSAAAAQGKQVPEDQAATADQVVHIVQPGDDLWTLSEHYYGSGQDWRRIARANPSLLTGGPDRLEPGWRLRIPDVDPAVRRVAVRAGDSLSAIAEREYGDAAAWHRIYQANRAVLSEPDVLPVGLTLNVPVTAHRPERDGQAGDRPGHQATTGGRASGRDPAETSATGRLDPDEQEHPAGAGQTEAPTAPDATASSSPVDTSAVDRPAVETAGGRAGAWVGQHAIQGAGIGGLMAAAVIGGLATRRQLQLRSRGVGRRIPQPPPSAQRLEAALGRRQTPRGLELLDLSLRAIGRDCHGQGRALPVLQAARSSDDDLALLMSEPDLPAAGGFAVDGKVWRLSPSAAASLTEDSTVMDAAQPYPGLASVGIASDGTVVLVNLEAAGLFAVADQDGRMAAGVLTAMATELAFSPWADELMITLVGDDHGLAGSIDRYNVSMVSDLDHLLDRWEQRARVQRDHLLADPGAAVGGYRIDPDLADPWVPEVGLILVTPDGRQAERLERLLLTEPPITLAAVVIGNKPMTEWRVATDPVRGGDVLMPLGWPLVPQVAAEPVAGLITELIGATGSVETDPAPWWAADFPDGSARPVHALDGPPSDDQPDVLSAEDRYTEAGRQPSVGPLRPVRLGGQFAADGDGLHAGSLRRPEQSRRRVDAALEIVGPGQTAAAGQWPTSAVRTTDEPVRELVATSDADWAWFGPVDRPRVSKEFVIVPNPFSGESPQGPRHPTIMLLGPAELLGIAGEPPKRAVMQCIEYCTWLLEHPGSTAQAMAAGLAVAEGTRRSNMSRLRNWLGSDDRGEPYLPDAYSGKIRLSPLVSSDWHRVQLLTHAGVNRTSTEGLSRALDLVRGAPLADAAPGQWHWAEELRTDMVSVVRDIGVELTGRALAAADLDLARWAASRALTAAPQDEFLIGARIRTEHQAGNSADVERLTLQLAAQGRALGVDLHPDTVDLLQQVIEGRLRARA